MKSMICMAQYRIKWQCEQCPLMSKRNCEIRRWPEEAEFLFYSRRSQSFYSDGLNPLLQSPICLVQLLRDSLKVIQETTSRNEIIAKMPSKGTGERGETQAQAMRQDSGGNKAKARGSQWGLGRFPGGNDISTWFSRPLKPQEGKKLLKAQSRLVHHSPDHHQSYLSKSANTEVRNPVKQSGGQHLSR